MLKEAQKNGVNREDANILMDWGKKHFPNFKNRIHEGHTDTLWPAPHAHIGGEHHIPIKP